MVFDCFSKEAFIWASCLVCSNLKKNRRLTSWQAISADLALVNLKAVFWVIEGKKSLIIIQDVVIENDAYTSSAFYFWGLRAIDSQHTVEVTAIVKKWHTSKTFCSGLPGVCSAAVTLHSFNNMIWTVDGVKVHKWNRHGGRGFVGFHYHKPV